MLQINVQMLEMSTLLYLSNSDYLTAEIITQQRNSRDLLFKFLLELML